MTLINPSVSLFKATGLCPASLGSTPTGALYESLVIAGRKLVLYASNRSYLLCRHIRALKQQESTL